MAKREGNVRRIIRLCELGEQRAQAADGLVGGLTKQELLQLLRAAYKLAKGCERAAKVLDA